MFGNAETRGVLASAIVHAGIALLFFRATSIPDPVLETQEIDLVETPPLPPPPPPRELDLGVTATEHATTRNVAAATHLASAVMLTEKTNASPMLPDTNESSNDPAQAAESASGAHLCEGDDCVLEALNRCLAGDGEGCTEVGLYYEERRRDPFSAIKWYVKGCGLASRAACDANDRVHNAMPAGWAHHDFIAPSFDGRSDLRSLLTSAERYASQRFARNRLILTAIATSITALSIKRVTAHVLLF